MIIVHDIIFFSFPVLSCLEIRFKMSTLKTLSEKSYTFIEKRKNSSMENLLNTTDYVCLQRKIH